MKQPIEIRLRENKQNLAIAFSAAEMYTLSAEMLRVESPSAEIQGHGKGEKRTIGGKKSVSITGVEPVGHYAIRLTFSDGHKTGLYTWDYLADLGANKDEIMAEYVSKLESLGLTRD